MTGKRPFTTTWGLTREEWDSKREQMRALLIDVAGQRGTITYGELARAVFEGRFSARSAALFQMLDEVCRIEDEGHDYEFGAIVVRRDTGIPGRGFFVFVDEVCGRHVDVDEAASCRRLWEREVAAVWDAYTPHDGRDPENTL